MKVSNVVIGLIALAGLAMVTLATGCNNECSFRERCDGDVRQVCGAADQMFNRQVVDEPCEAPSGVCVELNETLARCVSEPATECDDSFESYCQDDQFRVHCPRSPYGEEQSYPVRFITAYDCGEHTDASCVETDGGSRCE